MTSNSKTPKTAAQRQALEQMKMEVAGEVGVNLKQGYNGDITSREAGSIGGGMVGLETAHYLCKDNQVTIVEMTATPGATMYPTVRNKLLSILKEDGVELLLNHALTAVEKDGLLMTCTDSEEPKQERMAVDEVVIAVGRKPNMDLYHEMGAAFERVVQAGDCIAGGSILEATRTGNDNVWFL